MEETEFYFQFAKSTHYSVKMDWRKEMSVDEDGSMVALDLGSDSDIGGKKCSDSRDIQEVKQAGPSEGLDVGGCGG